MKKSAPIFRIGLAILLACPAVKGQTGSADGTSGGSRVDFSFPAPLTAGKYAVIALPEQLSPVSLTDDGTVIFREFGFGGDAIGYRWKSGQLTPLSVPEEIKHGGYFPSPMMFQTTSNGWVMASYLRMIGSPSTFIWLWPPGEANPVRLPAPQIPIEGFEPAQSILDPILNTAGKIWAKVLFPVSDGEQPVKFAVWESLFGYPRVLDPNGWAVTVAGVNASGTLIGTYAPDPEDPSSVRGFVGAFANAVEFEPRLINDAGWVVGVRAGPSPRNILWKDGQEFLLPDGDIDEIDQFNNLHGYTLTGKHVMWTTDLKSRVSNPTGGTYLPINYVPPSLPDGWTSDLEVVPGDHRLKLGYCTYRDPSDPQAAARVRPVLLVPAEIAVDASRDATISLAGEGSSDATSADHPYRFWINDDDDSGETKASDYQDVPLEAGAGRRNADDTQVNGVRDLVDFFPVYLDIRQLLTVLPATGSVKYKLKQADTALGIVFTSHSRSEAFNYSRGSTANLNTGFGPQLIQNAGQATVVKITATGVELPETFLGLVAGPNGAEKGIALVEASTATTRPLILSVEKPDGTVMAEMELPLKIDPVVNMIHWFNIRSLAHGTAPAGDNQGLHYADAGVASGSASNAPAELFPDVANRKNVVFIHGYNVNGREAGGTAAEMFKRLYWGGSKARFYAVLWRGNDYNAVNFQLDVGHAWQQAPYVRKLLNNLQGDAVIVAHSAGNMVAMAAMCYDLSGSLGGGSARIAAADRPANVKNYFAIDAAVPLEALSDSDRTEAAKALMRHHAWNGYDERLWPTHWHALFPSSDGRHALTWLNAFAALDLGTNLYSSGDEVLENPASGDDIMPVWDTISPLGHHAWVAHEKSKGGQLDSANPLKIAGETAGFALLRSNSYAGWSLNHDWYTGPETHGGTDKRLRFPSEAGETDVPTAALSLQPFFTPFQDHEDGIYYPGYQGGKLLAPLGDVAADTEARRLSTFAKILGEEMPGLSFAQGSNFSNAFRPLGGNLDLNTNYSALDHQGFKNGWPAERGTSEKDKIWMHGDYIIVAYSFIFPLFDKLVDNGNLK
jgi:hypothetical protein